MDPPIVNDTLEISLYNIPVGNTNRLGCEFFARPTLEVARDLLGQRLVRLRDGKRLAGLITETEAYISEADLACHARFGRTPRSEVLYASPGHAYVYLNYGMYWLLNIVTEAQDFPAAVLIRGIRADEGIEVMRELRGRPEVMLTNGPGKLTRALDINGSFNRMDMCSPEAILFIEPAPGVLDSQVLCGPRVGIHNVPEPWRSKPWRFWVQKIIVRRNDGF
jgi:DNA-3-methyladenine glycosylase